MNFPWTSTAPYIAPVSKHTFRLILSMCRLVLLWKNCPMHAWKEVYHEHTYTYIYRILPSCSSGWIYFLTRQHEDCCSYVFPTNPWGNSVFDCLPSTLWLWGGSLDGSFIHGFLASDCVFFGTWFAVWSGVPFPSSGKSLSSFLIKI